MMKKNNICKVVLIAFFLFYPLRVNSTEPNKIIWFGDSISVDLWTLLQKNAVDKKFILKGVGGEPTKRTLEKVKHYVNDGNFDDIIITTGTHSITHNADIDTLLLEIERCLDYCYSRNKKINISLSLIPYTEYKRFNQKIKRFNDGIIYIVNNKKYLIYNVYIKDFNSIIKSENLKYDGIHLTGGRDWQQLLE